MRTDLLYWPFFCLLTGEGKKGVDPDSMLVLEQMLKGIQDGHVFRSYGSIHHRIITSTGKVPIRFPMLQKGFGYIYKVPCLTEEQLSTVLDFTGAIDPEKAIPETQWRKI